MKRRSFFLSLFSIAGAAVALAKPAKPQEPQTVIIKLDRSSVKDLLAEIDRAQRTAKRATA